MKYNFLFILIIFLAYNSTAQNIIQDNKGQTSLNLNPGNDKAEKDSTKIETVQFGLGQVKISSAEKKLELNYYQYFIKPKTAHHNAIHSFLGVSAAAEVDNSLSSAFSSGDIAPGTDIKLRGGIRLFKRKIGDFSEWDDNFRKKHNRAPTENEIADFVFELSTASDLWLVTNAGFIGSKFKLFHPDSSYDNQLEKITFSSPQFNIGLNYWSARILNCVTLIGATIGIKKSNNFDDLVESTSEEVTTRTNSPDTSTRKITAKNTVYKGTYKETTTYPLNFDIYFKPHKFENVAFLLYAHHDIIKNDKPQTKLGGGFYFLRKNNLFDPVLGVNVDFSDVFNNDPANSGKRVGSKLNIGIVTDLKTLLFQKRN